MISKVPLGKMFCCNGRFDSRLPYKLHLLNSVVKAYTVDIRWINLLRVNEPLKGTQMTRITDRQLG